MTVKRCSGTSPRRFLTLSTVSVKTGKSRSEQMLSALPPLATGERTFWIGSFVPQAAVRRRSKVPFYSITSSARASSVSGISRPSALAVLRLMTSSYFVGPCTGRSAGRSPLRMRLAYRPITWYAPAILGP